MNAKNYFFGILAVAIALPTLASAQARKIPMFEHFTQASCAPCAAQNPAFTTLYNANSGNLHHVAIHTSWPGTDPMYAANATESASMVALYGVSGVPNMIFDGVNIGGPAGVSQGMINDAANGSPIEVIVGVNGTGTSRIVQVDIKNYDNLPVGNYIVRTMVVEKMVNYTTAPGSNGEKNFPNVFRKTIGGTTGRPYVPTAGSSTVTFIDTLALDAAWNASQIYVIAYVQNTATKEVLNSGSNLDPEHSYFNVSPVSFTNGASNFTATLKNNSTSPVSIDLNLTTNAPAGWTASYTVQGMTYTTNANIMVPAATSIPLTLSATPSTTAGVGNYKVTATATGSTFAVQTTEYTLISGVTDLLVNNNTGFSDGVTRTWQPLFEAAAATTANAATFGSVENTKYIKGLESGALAGVHSIYRNCGWTFPAITDAEVAQLIPYLNGGGNLFICGQDVAWEIADAQSPYASPAKLDFLNNYLKTDYIADGSASRNQLAAVPTDGYYGTTPTAAITGVYGATNFFPDEVAAVSGGSLLFKYNATAVGAGVRSDTTSNYKIVYIAPGLEMLSSAPLRNQIFKTTHDWFHGLISPIKLDETFASAMGDIYPNPAQNTIILQLTDLQKDAILQIQDVLGKKVLTQNVTAGTTTLNIDISHLASGTYNYQIVSGNAYSTAKKLVIIK